jgi:hypothetical protein
MYKIYLALTAGYQIRFEEQKFHLFRSKLFVWDLAIFSSDSYYWEQNGNAQELNNIVEMTNFI